MNEKLAMLERYLTGQAHPNEQLLVENWLDEQAAVNPEWEAMDHMQKAQWMADTYAMIHASIAGDAVTATPAPAVVRRMGTWIRIAAVLAGLLLTGIALYVWMNRRSAAKAVVKQEHVQPAVLPGRDRAILTLSDGTKVALDSLGNGRVAMQGGTEIVFRNGALVYDNRPGTQQAEVMYNTVHTPKGGQFKLMLPDGTQVWLNAASSIRYPVAFTGDHREVDVTGEAYFEVAHNKAQPFVAYYSKEDKPRTGSVTVLGTHFNLNTYADEPYILTTLLEGRVACNDGSATAMLLPGQQAIASGNLPEGEQQKMTVITADTEEATAWKNGLFNFKEDRLDAIMRQIVRWYDVKIVWAAPEAREKHFTGIMSRKDNVEAVLRSLSMTEAVHFAIEGRTITVRK